MNDTSLNSPYASPVCGRPWNRIQPVQGGLQDRDGSAADDWRDAGASSQRPKLAFSITICMATLRWMLKNEFGIEFLGMEELRRERLAQYLRGLAVAAA